MWTTPILMWISTTFLWKSHSGVAGTLFICYAPCTSRIGQFISDKDAQRAVWHICIQDDLEADFNDDYVKKLQKAVKEIKQSREMGARFMSFEEHMRDQWKAGRAEGREELLKEQIKKKLAKGLSAEEIAEMLEITVEEVQKLM